MKKHNIIFIGLLPAFLFGCTNLDVTPYREMTASQFYKNEDQVLAAVERPYTHANAWAAPTGQMGHYRVSELSADQISWPQKGRHGLDGEQWGRLHYHSWSTNDNLVWDPWNLMFWGMGFTNNTLEDFEGFDFESIGISETNKNAYIGELKALRAWHYLKLMDLYGNIPITTSISKTADSPPTVPQAKVFDWIESEFKAISEDMWKLDNNLVGRINRAAVYAMLVEMYLNAEVWTGTPRWDECIAYCDKIINGDGGAMNGTMQLDANIDDTYAYNNKAISKEGIFHIAYSRNNGMWLGRGDYGWYAERDIVGAEYGGNNGMVVNQNAFELFGDKDLRKYSWFFYGVGQGYGGYDFQGPYKDIGRRRSTYTPQTEEFLGMPMIFAYKPIKVVVDEENGRVVLKEWYSAEFPELSDAEWAEMEDALNSTSSSDAMNTQKIILDAMNREVNPTNEFYLSGGYGGRGSDSPQYSWSTMNDYRYVWADCKENTGARYNKYKTGTQSTSGYGDNCWVLYRLSEIYFAKAEALMRKNGGTATQEAVNLINEVKARAFLPEYWESAEAVTNGDRYTATTLTMDELLDERGREFIFEGKRRQDLIRFDKFEFNTGSWWDADFGYTDGSAGAINKDKSRRLFPIPYRQTEVNPNLIQNPGYVNN